MSLKAVAQETLAICERGSYRAPSGREVAVDMARARDATVLYKPVELPRDPVAGVHRTSISVTEETTAAAARRLGGDVAILNFASARNVGGGFINGARAQEEDLCRKSALYPCLLTARAYYDDNRAADNLYTDHLIYSPRVPFFRDEELELVDEPYFASVVTSPAPNAGALRTDDERARLHATFVRRIAQVLSVFAAQGHPRIVLGAWGCGAFRNDPVVVAELFDDALRGPYADVFAEVVFAIYDRAKGQQCLTAFRARFQ